MSTIAILSFPGMNCEVETLRALRRNGFDASIVRWNANQESLASYNAYILPGGFSYEDRGRAGMVAAHHPLVPFLAQEAEKGKTIIGICNGAQVLVESGLIPLGKGLQMALARNQVSGFRNEWIWIRRTCRKGRCIGSDFDEILHLPIAHGEGRFQTKDTDVVTELRRQDLIAFSYCTNGGTISDAFPVNPNGSLFSIAGLCNPAGNILALMPHPERTRNGDPFFRSLHTWIEREKEPQKPITYNLKPNTSPSTPPIKNVLPENSTEIFIDTIITNNEERTIETTLRTIHPHSSLKQLRYFALPEGSLNDILCNITLFNPHRDIAYVRRKEQWFRWKNAEHTLEPLHNTEPFQGTMLLRHEDEVKERGKGQPLEKTCYICANISEQKLYSKEVLEILTNPHASMLERVSPFDELRVTP